MIGEIEIKDGKLATPNASVSSFAPEENIRNLTAQIKKDYQIGVEVLTTPYPEFGGAGLSPLIVAERDRLAFNSYENPVSADPDQSWRWRGIRPITRNKIISIAGHFIANLLYPNIFAQNDQDEEDKDAANLMKDLILWNIENSNYGESYLFGIVAALVNPVAYLEVEFAQVLRNVKEKNDRGEIALKEAVDEILSGFRMNNVPMDEILIDNPYEYHLQNQRFIGRKRYISWDDAKARFGKHKNWKYLRPGVRTVFDIPTQTFYDIADESNHALVEWFIYYNRGEDMEISYVNGVYFGDDDISKNMMNHRRIGKTLEGEPVLVPIYPFVKFGYGIIDEKRFYFYKSAVNELGPQQRLVDRMWQMTMDGSFLDIIPPLAITGRQIVGSNIIYPGAITTFKDKDTSITPIRVGSNLASGYRAMQDAQADLIETSRVPQLPAKSGTTAREVSAEIEQSRRELGVFGAMIAEAVTQIGMLMIDVILQHQTVGDVEEITAGEVRLRYRTFLLPNQDEDGRKVNKRIELVDREFGDKFEESMGILDEEGGLDSDKRIYRVNPPLFRRLRFLVRVDPDQLVPKNEIFEKALKLEAFDRLIASEFTNHEAVTKDFLVEPFAKGETAKYMMKDMGSMNPMNPMNPMGGGQIMPGRSASMAGTRPGNIIGKITGNSPLAELVRA